MPRAVIGLKASTRLHLFAQLESSFNEADSQLRIPDVFVTYKLKAN